MKVKITRGISDSNIKKAAAALERSRKQIDKLLATCKQVEATTHKIFDGDNSQYGPTLNKHARSTIKHLTDCRQQVLSAISLTQEIPH
jgi:hypothetical protein